MIVLAMFDKALLCYAWPIQAHCMLGLTMLSLVHSMIVMAMLSLAFLGLAQVGISGQCNA